LYRFGLLEMMHLADGARASASTQKQKLLRRAIFKE
jgi:hypothetical protein